LQAPALVPAAAPASSAWAAVESIERFIAEARDRAPIPVLASAECGSPAAVLLDAAQSAAMLVVGSRGLGGFAGLALGSTSVQCATHSTVPTTVVRPNAHRAMARHIMVAFDGSPHAAHALRWAVDFAAPGSVVRVVGIWDAAPLAVGSDAFFFPEAYGLAIERFDDLVGRHTAGAGAADVRVERDFREGRARAELRQAALGADLVVVGARGHGGVGALVLGSVSTWMLHHCDGPLVVVP
jgi:nucleotide-binding universal stress UspA family protein